MINKHAKRSIHATYQRTFLKRLLKKTFELTKQNPNIEKTCILLTKLLALFNYWSDQMMELVAAVSSFSYD